MPSSGSAVKPPPYGVSCVDARIDCGEQYCPSLERFAGSGGIGKRSVNASHPYNPGELPYQLKAGIEKLSGISLNGIRVHFNSPKPAQFGAAAFARGKEIHLAKGQEQHLPHEAWHLVQQAQGRVASNGLSINGCSFNDDVNLEREAEVMGEKALNTRANSGINGVEGESPSFDHKSSVDDVSAVNSVIQCTGLLGWLNKRTGYKKVVGEDDKLANEARIMAYRADASKEKIEEQRRDGVKEGVVKVMQEGAKMGADIGGTAVCGVPIGTAVGGVVSAVETVKSGRKAYRQTGKKGAGVKAGVIAAFKKGTEEGVAQVPVVGEFVGMAQGVGKIGYALAQSEESRGKNKQKAINVLIQDETDANEIRQRLEDSDVEPKIR